mmetsp:Transcript_10573/g.35874  ORF Transcript_10573/g.35874 Transcript_10573/m.35874 type:complete len:293 (+) Transcript_10573:97-975(+)
MAGTVLLVPWALRRVWTQAHAADARASLPMSVRQCRSTGMITARFSATALGRPGRLTMSVRPRIPATALESMASGSCWRARQRTASAMPGTSAWHTAPVTSGVTSRGAQPVPPVVRMRLQAPVPSDQPSRRCRIASASSATTARSRTWTSQFPAGAKARISRSIVGPLSSAYTPAAARSLTVRMPRWITSGGPEGGGTSGAARSAGIARRASAAFGNGPGPAQLATWTAPGSTQHTSDSNGAGGTGGCPSPCTAWSSLLFSNRAICSAVAFFWCLAFQSAYDSPYTRRQAPS